MAALSNTLLTTGGSALVGQREDLSELVSKIDPAETPVWSWLGKGTAKNDLAHDWQTVDLDAPVRAVVAEGDEFTNAAPKRTTRLTNVCEIQRKVYGVSGTSAAVDTAGNTGALNFQRLHKGMELRKDLERAVIGPQAKSQTDPREMAGLQAWAGTADVGTGGTAPTGNGATAVVHGTERLLSADLLNQRLRAAWVEGAQISLLVMSSAQKLAYDSVIPLESIVDNNVDITANGAVVTTTVSIWKSTFGDIKVIMDRPMDEIGGNFKQFILGFDERSTYRPKVCPLPGRSFVTYELAKTSDSDREAMVWEGTIEVPNPKAVSLLAALDDTYAS